MIGCRGKGKSELINQILLSDFIQKYPNHFPKKIINKPEFISDQLWKKIHENERFWLFPVPSFGAVGISGTKIILEASYSKSKFVIKLKLNLKEISIEDDTEEEIINEEKDSCPFYIKNIFDEKDFVFKKIDTQDIQLKLGSNTI